MNQHSSEDSMEGPTIISVLEPGWDRLMAYNNMVPGGPDEFLCPFKPRDEPHVAESAPPCSQWSVHSVTTESAMEALRRHVSERGLDPRAAAEAKVTHIEPLHSFRYRLETFTERRVTRWSREPYTGQEADDWSVPPQPWDMPVEEPVPFRANTKDIPVPGTALVMDCAWCKSKGKFNCNHCNGGKVSCYNCHGKGWTYNFTSYYSNTNHCYICSGRGRTTCIHCGGNGQSTCPLCKEAKKVMVSITVRVKWMNYPDEVLCGDKDVPHAQQLPGQTLLTHSAPRVAAVTEFPEPSVVQASLKLVQEHSEKYSDSHILQQRQTIELLSVTRVSYAWRGQPYEFYISGADGGAIVDDYPESSFCHCCSVM